MPTPAPLQRCWSTKHDHLRLPGGGGGGFGRCEIQNSEMWHNKIVPHFAVVFKDRSHVLAFTKSMHMFSPLQGPDGLNCWGHHVSILNPVSQVSCRESRQLSCRIPATIQWNSAVRFLYFPSFGKFTTAFHGI